RAGAPTSASSLASRVTTRRVCPRTARPTRSGWNEARSEWTTDSDRVPPARVGGAAGLRSIHTTAGPPAERATRERAGAMQMTTSFPEKRPHAPGSGAGCDGDSMSQRGVERVIGSLATDEGLRRRFRKDPQGVVQELVERGLE